MKANNYIIIALIAAIAFACLGESGNKIQVGNYPGVVGRHGDSVFIYLKGNERVYAATGAGSLNPNDCVLIDFLLDYSKAENADSGRIKGFLTIDLRRAAPVQQFPLLTVEQDTLTAMPGERMLLAALGQHAFIKDKFFFFTSHPADSLPLQFDLYCDLQSPRIDNVYDLYLRIAPVPEAQKATQAVNRTTAFALDALSSREADSLFFRIRYVNRINEQPPTLSWAATEVYRFGK
ncbi:MAG: hypothetical protein LBD28_05550 [Tannerellaceae bacterium]|jgi:hypothetical protein|nr:hypothetical protein [Tannerellaceae bacterium]